MVGWPSRTGSKPVTTGSGSRRRPAASAWRSIGGFELRMMSSSSPGLVPSAAAISFAVLAAEIGRASGRQYDKSNRSSVKATTTTGASRSSQSSGAS
jgi:hypothetical protein